MQTIKKYWGWILAFIGTVIGILFISKKYNQKQIDKTDKKIDTNNQTIDKLDGKIDAIEDQKQDAKQAAEQIQDQVDDLKQQREEIKPDVVEDTAQLKQDIIAKTKRRGRKPKGQQ
jgi:outer membrane murein-binding lipoprotein Lpp